MKNSRLAVIKDKRFGDHKTPESHPESPERISAINDLVRRFESEFDYLEPREATEEELASTHSPGYIEDLHQMAEVATNTDSLIGIDPDTVMSPKSYTTAKLAVGAALEGVDCLAKQTHDSCFVAVRPPGHHALADRAMGFCLFNNVAIAANQAKAKGFKRIFILDWDVHHGNGTQALFYDDPTVFFASLHQHPFWPPGSGYRDEFGDRDGEGFNLNIPLPEGTGDVGYLKCLDEIVGPICLDYKPDMIIVSAGYDAHKDDFIAGQNLSTVGFAMMSQRVADWRDTLDTRVLCLLEGGYNTHALADSVMATMRVLNASGPEELGQVHASYMVPATISGGAAATNDSQPDKVSELIERIKEEQGRFHGQLKL